MGAGTLQTLRGRDSYPGVMGAMEREGGASAGYAEWRLSDEQQPLVGKPRAESPRRAYEGRDGRRGPRVGSCGLQSACSEVETWGD